MAARLDMTLTSRRLFVCVLLAVAGAARPAIARTCGAIAPAVAALSEADAQARLTYLTREIENESQRAQMWSGLWRSGYTAIAAAQMALTPFQNRADRLDGYVGTASSLVGVIALTVAPLDVIEDGRDLEVRSARMARLQGVCAALTQMEHSLLAAAADERQNKGWVTHAGNAAFNFMIGAILAYGLNHKVSGAINTVAGVAIGEVMIATQPDHLTDVLRAYRIGGKVAPRSAAVQWGPSSWDTGSGLALRF